MLGEDGKQIGVVKKEEALTKAREMGVDLVEIAGKAKPPVCRLIEFKKFKYLEAKKERLSKKGVKDTVTKEVRLRPFTDDHDLEVRYKMAQKFLTAGHKVKFIVKFNGREISKKEFGYEVLNKISRNLESFGKVDRPPYPEGRTLVMVFSPSKIK